MEHAKQRENFEKLTKCRNLNLFVTFENTEMAIAVFAFASSIADDELVDQSEGNAREEHFFVRAEGLRRRDTM